MREFLTRYPEFKNQELKVIILVTPKNPDGNPTKVSLQISIHTLA